VVLQQKIVIKVAMSSNKCRSKAMALVAKTSGVESVEIAGDSKDQVVVLGDGVGSTKLTCTLRKKVGPAQLMEVADATKKKEEEKKLEEVMRPCHCPPYPYVVCEQGPEYACTIL
jgi:hypothetical protein